jgi:hypothetical protein
MELPPVMRIACDEKLWTSDSPHALKRRIISGGLLEELTRQAMWSLDEHAYVDAKHLSAAARSDRVEFCVVPSATLNPFSPVGKCLSPACAPQASNDFVKTVGLYTEVAVIPDPLTAFFMSESDRDDEEFVILFRHLKVLEEIQPLFEAGVLRVATPVHSYCEDCNQEIERFVTEAADEIVAGISSYKAGVMGTKQQGFHLALELPVLQPPHEHPLLARTRVTNSEAALLENTFRARNRKSKPGRKLLRRLMANTVKQEMNSVFFQLDTARRLDSLLLTGSRSEALVISTLDKAAPKLSEIEDWERLRTVELPWIERLSCEEVLRLREDANIALPRLRELLRKELIASSKDSKEVPTVVAELRNQALEVEAELSALTLPKERRFRAGMSGLAMSFVVYGFATQSPHLMAASMAGLLATLAHLRSTERDHDNKVATLTSKPAYALLRARQILKNRREQV